MIYHYSIVIHPDFSFIEKFARFKDTLYKKVGKYGSRNSDAHITILEFLATEKELLNIIQKISKISQKEVPFSSVFNKVVYTTTLFFSPDKVSIEKFTPLLNNVRLRIGGIPNRSKAHLTVGRKLKSKQIKDSQGLFENEKFDFTCNQLALRKWNDKTGQFDVIQIFPLLGREKKDDCQRSSLW